LSVPGFPLVLIMEDKIIILAKKLKALADGGIGGEKTNAIKMLETLMKKHSITMEMIEGKIIKEHEFFLLSEEYQFFHQVAASVFGNDGPRPYKFMYKGGKRAPGKDRCGIDCSYEDFIYLMAKHQFFYNQYLEDQKIFYSAFVQKNKLYTKPCDDEEELDSDRPPLTPQEKARLFKIANVMQGLDRAVFNKQLG